MWLVIISKFSLPPDALSLFLQNLASVTRASPYSNEHLAFGIWDTELVMGEMMSRPWGIRLDGFSFAPQKHPLLLLLLPRQDYFPVPPDEAMPFLRGWKNCRRD